MWSKDKVKMKNTIFSVSGWRGVVGKDFQPDDCRQLAERFCLLMGRGKYVVGRDPRPSGKELLNAVRSGLLAQSCDVIDLDICPTPSVVHFVRSTPDTKGGLIITASHNPLEWNGIKFVHPEGRFILPAELDQLKSFSPAPMSTNNHLRTGRVWSLDGIDIHIQAIRENRFFQGINNTGLRIGIDAVNGAVSKAAGQLLNSFGCENKKIFCSPEDLTDHFPRPPEPTAENIAALSQLVKQEKLDAGFAFDPDGDRLSCVDETGSPLGEEATLCLAALYILAQKKGDVVINLSTSRMIEDIGARFGVRVFRTKVGEANVIEKIKLTNAILGGEGNGGVILPEVNLTRDGLVAMATVIGLMTRTGKRLSVLRQELPEYRIVKRTVADDGLDQQKIAPWLTSFLGPNVATDFTDGIRIAGPDWWVHIRQSNTEPIVRIIAEARNQRTAEELIARVIANWQNRG